MKIQEVSLEESEKMGLVEVDGYTWGYISVKNSYVDLDYLRTIFPKVNFYLLKPNEKSKYYKIRADKILIEAIEKIIKES